MLLNKFVFLYFKYIWWCLKYLFRAFPECIRLFSTVEWQSVSTCMWTAHQYWIVCRFVPKCWLGRAFAQFILAHYAMVNNSKATNSLNLRGDTLPSKCPGKWRICLFRIKFGNAFISQQTRDNGEKACHSFITARVRSTREGIVFTGVCSHFRGYPIQSMGVGYPIPGLAEGPPPHPVDGGRVPHPRSRWGDPLPGVQVEGTPSS